MTNKLTGIGHHTHRVLYRHADIHTQTDKQTYKCMSLYVYVSYR